MNVRKRRDLIFVGIFVVLIFSLSLISAGWFSDTWNKITGKGVVTSTCQNYPLPDYCGKSESIIVTGVDSNGCSIYGCNTSVVSSCTDSDGGINYYVWGAASVDNPDGSSSAGMDACGGTRILEFYCDSYGKIQSIGYNCSYGCTNGACNSASSCTLPWGGTIAHGQSVTAYFSNLAVCGSACYSQIRTCNNGVLSGNLTYQSCYSAPCLSCTLPWNSTMIAHGKSVTAYLKNAVAYSSNCSSQTRTCNNGVLSGSYTYQNCSVTTVSVNVYTAVEVSIETTQTKVINISWKSLNAPSDAWVGVIRMYKGDLFLYDIVPSFSKNSASGSILYSLSTNHVTGEDFKIHVVLNTGSVGSESNIAQGWSNTFSVYSPQTKCTDSDGGLDYYEKGIAKGMFYNTTQYAENYDYCIQDTNILVENHCEDNYVKDVPVYSCPNGCQDGACVQSLGNTSECSFLFEGETQTLRDINGKSYEVSLNFIGESEVKFSVNGNLTTYIQEGQVYQLNDGAYIGVWDIFYSSKDDGISKVSYAIATESSFFGNKSNCASLETQVCSSLIDKITNPVSSEYTPWGYSSNYSGKMWVDSSRENYTGYYAGYYTKSSLEYDYSSVDYSLIVFDNKDINLSDFVERKYDDMACKREYSYSSAGYYFICNWNALMGESASENWNYFDLFWYNKNVLVHISIYYGRDLTDAELAELSAKKIEDFMNSLIDNPSQYLWDKFSMPYYVQKDIYDSLEKCGSEVKEGSSLYWSCKTEPVICPPHGYQTKTCSAYNYETGEYDTRENKISCSPGICSGCYVPRWFGQHGGDNKCIPYGFRFEQETEDFITVWKEETQEDSLTQGDIDADEGYLDVTSNTTATLALYYYEKNLTLNLVKGQKSEINFSEYDDEDYILVLLPTEISYYGAGNSQNFVKFMITIKYLDKEYLKANMYCDIDGEFKVQKTKEYGGEWARCQNNYECESNLCSAGECVEVHDMIESASMLKATWIKIGCRISSIFTSQTYNECVADSLGEDYLSTQAG